MTTKLNNKGKRIIGFRFAGNYYAVDTWKGLLITISEIISRQYGPSFYEHAKELRGSKLVYFSKNTTGMREPKKIGDTNVYVETKWDADAMETHCRRLISQFGYSDWDLKIEKSSDFHSNSGKQKLEESQKKEMIRIQPESNFSQHFEVGNPDARPLLKRGDFVSNPKAPQRGIGEVVGCSEEYLEIVFSDESRIRSFLRKKNSLVKIENPESQFLNQLAQQKAASLKVTNGLEETKTDSGGMDKRVERDAQNAQYAIEIAKNKLKRFSVTTEQPDITRGFSKGYLASTAASAKELSGLEVVVENPFHAMMEVETEVRGKRGGNLSKSSFGTQMRTALATCPWMTAKKR